LLRRFRSHPLWAEIDDAQRYHEVPYVLPGDRGIIDLLYRVGSGWVIVDFKTNAVQSEAEMCETIRLAGYDNQVKRYAEAVSTKLGHCSRALLVFLQFGNDKIGLAEIDIKTGE